jgi:hypothetical protein
MATNAEFYSDTYSKGALDHWETLLTSVRESAKETNKTRSEVREELNKYIKDLDAQIGQSQKALESLNIEHFRAHIKATESQARRYRAGASAGAKLSKELEKIEKEVRGVVAGSLGGIPAEGKVNALITNAKKQGISADDLQYITEASGVLRVLGKYGVEFGRTKGERDKLSPLDKAKLAAVSLGMEQGLRSGMSNALAGEGTEGLGNAAFMVAKNTTGVPPSKATLSGFAQAGVGQVVKGASRRSGGLTNANIDAMLVESGLALATAQRTADLQSLRTERDLAVREAATLPGAMTEEDILAEAASKMGPVGSLAGEYGPGIIGAFRRRKAAKDSLKASRMEAEANEAIRTQISSLAPEQRVFLGAMAKANAAYSRNPDAFTGMKEYMALAEQLEEAKKNDPSLSGDQVRLATLALDLAKQKNPKGSAQDLQRDRDRILQAFGYRFLQQKTLKGNETPKEVVKKSETAKASEDGVTPLENRPALQAMLKSLGENHPLRKQWEERLAKEGGKELSDIEKKLKEAGATELKAAYRGDPYGHYAKFEDGTYGYVDRKTGEVVRVSATSVGGKNIAAVFAGTPVGQKSEKPGDFKSSDLVEKAKRQRQKKEELNWKTWSNDQKLEYMQKGYQEGLIPEEDYREFLRLIPSPKEEETKPFLGMGPGSGKGSTGEDFSIIKAANKIF